VSTLTEQTLPPNKKNTKTTINFDSILDQQSYITNINEFLQENDSGKALRYWINEFISSKQLKSARDIRNAILRTIADIDEIINDQLNYIIHHPSFLKLEASWRGLWYLVEQTDETQNIKLKFLDISWQEVVKDIGRAMEFDQSQLFHKIYSEEYGTPGGEPYGALIGDYELSHKVTKKHPHDDIATLQGIAQIAAAAFSPFIAAASSELFGMDDFSDLAQPLNLQSIFSQKEYIKWQSLREITDSRFIGLTLPRILMRKPYQTKPGSYKGIYFHEKLSNNINNYVWGNASYAFGAVLLREFSNVGWFGHIRGVPRNYISGGLVTSLPVDYFATDADGIAHKSLTDVVITDSLEKDISELGFIPLCQSYMAPFAAFYNNQSIQRPKVYSAPNVDTNAKLSAMLQHVLCGSRIAHYIKIMIRDKVGSFITANRCEDYLRNWLLKYTTGREDMDWDEQARYPLKEADVSVREHPAKPGDFLCIIHLQPHYQLDQMISELELVTELASLG